MRHTKILGALAILFLVGVPAYAQEYGTPAEAKAMLEKAVAALKVDQTKALQMFTKGEGGFRDKDSLSLLRRAGRQLHRPSDAGREEPQGFDG